MKIAIVGGGIAGLGLALNLHRAGISCTVFERAAELKELGYGITILPHAMREFEDLGVMDQIVAQGVENTESSFFNRFGQLLYSEPRGFNAGYPRREVGIHRGKLHMILYKAVCERMGDSVVKTDRAFVGVDQSENGVKVHFLSSDGEASETIEADAVVACDGVNSTVRKRFYPDEKLAFGNINIWRGVSPSKPILNGHTYIRIGSILTGKMVLYPIIDDFDGKGHQLINWAVERQSADWGPNEWNIPAKLEDIIDGYKDWVFDWLDVPELMRNAGDSLIEYPMVDKDPVKRWSFDRVTFAGDAAHPMYPRGSNGAAQAVIDVRTLASSLKANETVPAAFREYESIRLPATARLVMMNRTNPPDAINIKVEELVGDRPFKNLDDYISRDELRAISERYKDVAGFSLEKAV